MDSSLFRRTRPLLAILMFGLLLAGCSDSKSPTASAPDTEDLSLIDDNSGDRDGSEPAIAPGEPNPATPVTSVEGLVAQLVELGFDATYQGQELERSFFLPPAHIVRISDQDVRVFLYDTVDDLKQDATEVSPDGGMLGTTSVHWIAPPHFYARSTFMALYVGDDADIIRVLASIFGAPFAGQGAGEPDIVIDVGDGQYHMGQPALIVVSTDEELQRLRPYLADIEADLESGIDLGSVDLSQNWIVAVFRGVMPTARHGIEIETVRLDKDGQVVVEISLTAPGINELVAQVITYPLDVMIVAREGLLDPTEVRWTAQTAEGRVLTDVGGNVSQDVDGSVAVDPIPVEPDEPFRLADVRGTIITVEISEVSDSDILARILVEGPGADDTVYDTAWVEVVQGTQVYFDGESFAPPTLADLAPGRRVQVSFVGPVRESFPVQAVAGTLVIYR